VGAHSAVVWKRLYFRPFPASRSAVGVAHGPPNALEAANPTSSSRTTSTLGAPAGGSSGSIGGNLASGSLASRGSSPSYGRSGIGRTSREIRSVNLDSSPRYQAHWPYWCRTPLCDRTTSCGLFARRAGIDRGMAVFHSRQVVQESGPGRLLDESVRRRARGSGCDQIAPPSHPLNQAGSSHCPLCPVRALGVPLDDHAVAATFTTELAARMVSPLRLCPWCPGGI
jgi:hypothetical protein